MKFYLAPLEGITGHIYRNALEKYLPGTDRYFTPFIAPDQNRILRTKERRDVLPYENLSLPMPLPDDKKTDEKNAKNAKSAKSAKTKDTKNANNAKSSKTDNVENADDTERDKSHNGAVKPERKQKPKKKRGGEGDDVDQKRR